MRYLLFLCCLVALPLHVLTLHALTLREEFYKAESGDFIVFAHQKQLTFFHIMEKTENECTIEEITVQEKDIDKNNSWQAWLASDAPGHTAWRVCRVSMTSGEILRSFSLVGSNWIQDSLNPQYSFLPTLLKLHLTLVPIEARKRIGPPPMPGEPDFRKLWQPKVYYEGSEQAVQCHVYRTEWPKDVSDLSGRVLYIYIPKPSSQALSFFPYWIEITGNIGKVKLRVVDSGRLLYNPALTLGIPE